MNKKALLTSLFTLFLVLGIYFSIKTIELPATYEDIIVRGFASVKSAAQTVTQKPAIKTGKTLNTFTLQPLPIFKLSAPFFSLLPITKNQYVPSKSASATTSVSSLFSGLADSTPSTKIQTPISTTKPASAPYTSPVQTYTAINPNIGDLIKTTIGIKPSIPSPTPTNDLGVSSEPSNSVVNILCTQKVGTLRKTITGTGILINSDGTILTNAHVAQYPLVAEKVTSVTCVARTGQNTEQSHPLSLVFVSPKWIARNAPHINTSGTLQTGQYDYALLKVSNISQTGLKPVDISYITPTTGSSLKLASYPADILATKSGNTLTKQTESLTLNRSDTFGMSVNPSNQGNTADIIETGPSRLGQRGSSGGLITSLSNSMVAMITIVLEPQSAGQNKPIRAITPKHIHADLSEYISGGLETISRTGSQVLQTKFALTEKDSLSSLLSQYLR